MINKVLLSYAAPCARERLRNKLMKKDEYELYMNSIKRNEEFPAEKFKKYFGMVCEKLDPEKATDREVRDYFFGEHNETHPKPCRVFEAEVVEHSDKFSVRNDTAEEFPAYVYTKERPKKGQRVVYHIDGIVDLKPRKST